MQETLAKRPALTTARKRLGLSREQAASRTIVTQQTIGDWENGGGGKSGPSYANLDAYCKALEALRVERGIDGDFRIEVLCSDLFSVGVGA